MSYVTGSIIKSLRETKKMTQRDLADKLKLSDKTISKWETGRGIPDISIIEDLAKVLNVSVTELLMGKQIVNTNRHANMKNVHFYVCPICGNIIQSIGEGAYSCCGVVLPETNVEENDYEHEIIVESVEDEYYVHLDHEMSKTHYLSFMAYVTSDSILLIKMYPEGFSASMFPKKGHGDIYAYCNRHGLYKVSF